MSINLVGELMYSVIGIITLIYFVLALIRQVKIKHKYNNGYVNHRKAFIGSTVILIMITISRLFLYSFNFDIIYTYSIAQIFNFYVITVGLLIVSIFNYMWFKGSNFTFLGSFINKEYLINFFKRKK